HRHTLAVEAERSVFRAHDRNDPVIDFWRKRPVDSDFLLACGFAFRKARIVEEGKANSPLDLESPRPLKENRGRMGIDPAYGRMLFRVRQEREDALLNLSVVCFRTRHRCFSSCTKWRREASLPKSWPEHCSSQDPPRAKLCEHVIGLDEREGGGLGSY